MHQICQTIVARLQRVTIQSLVRFLGLDDEVLGTGGKGYFDKVKTVSSDKIKVPERKPRKTPEWKKFEQSLADDPTLDVSLLDQAIFAAASLLGLSQGKSKILKEDASIVAFSPGSTICRTGEAPGAIYLIIRGTLEVGLEKNGNFQNIAPALEKQSIAKRKENVKYTTRQVNEHRISKPLFSAGPGTFIGLFSTFTNDSSFINVKNSASENAILLRISSQTFEKVVSSHPRALIHCLLDILDTIGSSPSMFLLGKLCSKCIFYFVRILLIRPIFE